MTNPNCELIDAFVDSFVSNDCLEDALALKWLRVATMQTGEI